MEGKKLYLLKLEYPVGYPTDYLYSCRSLPKVKREAKRRKVSFQQVKEAGPVNKKPLLEQEDNPLVSVH